jgi:hypothetical protein
MNKHELFQAIIYLVIIILLSIMLSDLTLIRNDIEELKDWLYLITKMLLD